MNGAQITKYQFRVYRCLAGLGLAFFWGQAAWSFEFSAPFWADFFPAVEWKSLISFFPNILSLGPLEVPLAIVAMLSSLLVAFGVARKFFASLVLYALACVHHSELMALSPLSLIMSVICIQLMLTPEHESAKGWRLKRWHSLAASVLLLFHLVLVVNPFVLPTRLLSDVSLAVSHLPLWLHAIFSLSFLMLAHKPWRWAFWFVQLVMVASFIFIGMDLSSFLLLLSLLTLAIDPQWLLPNEAPELIVFYDGNCGLCHGLVRFLLDIDKAGATKFAPLQESFAHKKLEAYPELLNDFETVVVLNNGVLTTKSQAVFEIFRYLGGPWALLSFLRLLPSSLTNYFYAFIAQRRYKIFGRYETCPLPSSEDRERFLTDL